MRVLSCLGVCFTVPLVGGRIADMVAGRFNTIYASFLILFVGMYVCVSAIGICVRESKN